MQDQIIASHVFWWTHGCELLSQFIKNNVSGDLKWTTNTHVKPFTLTSKA